LNRDNDKRQFCKPSRVLTDRDELEMGVGLLD
jgi:hypothetical protein